MAKKPIVNADKVRAAFKIQLIEAKRESDTSVVVGYKASYALWVHENTEMKWRGLPRTGKHPSGQKKKGYYWGTSTLGGYNKQSKFLEQPLRENRKHIGAIIRKAYEKGMRLDRAIKRGALFLQRMSQKLVPIDTGNLKGSAFTEIEK
jgi:hypothetical protein